MKRLLSPWWALITLGVLIYAFANPSNFIQSIKLNYFDQLIVSQEPVENNIYVAEIDEAALELYGQYPFHVIYTQTLSKTCTLEVPD